MAIADFYGEDPSLGAPPAMQPAMPAAPMPTPAPAPAPIPMAQRSIGGFIAQQRNDPANWVTLTNQGAVRNLPIVEALQKNLQTAIATVYGQGYRAQVYSGGQPVLGSGQPRVGSTRHDGGLAADLHILDPQGNRVTGDKLARIARHWLENRIGGVGLEMRDGGIHLDMHQNRSPVWTYGPVSPAQAALVREFGGRATERAPTMTAMAQANTPRQAPAAAQAAPATPGVPMQMPMPMPAVPEPMLPPSVGLANLFALENQRRVDEARREEEDAVRARRQALFGGPGPFG